MDPDAHLPSCQIRRWIQRSTSTSHPTTPFAIARRRPRPPRRTSRRPTRSFSRRRRRSWMGVDRSRRIPSWMTVTPSPTSIATGPPACPRHPWIRRHRVLIERRPIWYVQSFLSRPGMVSDSTVADVRRPGRWGLLDDTHVLTVVYRRGR